MGNKLNIFVVNPLVLPDHVILMVTGGYVPVCIWAGRRENVPEDLFNRADEAHVCQETYDWIAAKGRETGRGIRIHDEKGTRH